VATGGGGTAGDDDAGLVPIAAALGLLALVAAGWGTWRSRAGPGV
jgi:hypothetical protein